MAASRVVSNHRLCVRYKYFFYVAVIILGLQVFLAYNFYSMKEGSQEENKLAGSKGPHEGPAGKKQDEGNQNERGTKSWSSSNDKLNNENGGKGPPGDEAGPDPNGQASNKMDGSQNDDPIPAAEDGGRRVARYQPGCDITGKEAVSAITRAKSLQCKQELADVTCLHNDRKLYPLHLPRFCPLKGEGRGEYLGCYKDKLNERDMDGGFVEIEENSPDNCIHHCLRGGFNYAGLQYGKECWCGESYGRHGQLQEAHCATPCPPPHSNATCGGYLATRLFRTGYGKTVRQPAPLTGRGEEGPGPQVRIVFVLTLNGRQVRQVVRLLRAIYHPHHYYYIHVDSRQEFLFRELLSVEERLDNVMVTRQRWATIWGGASLLQAHLAFLAELLDKAHWHWDYYINLSESDYPIKTVADLTRYLTAYKGLNFLKSHGKDTPRFIKKQGLDQTFYECENHLWRIGHRPLPSGVRVDGGSDWVCLYRDFARYIVHESDPLLEGLKALYKYTLLPAESFFHTVLQNSGYCGQSVDNNLHLTNWRRKQGCKCQYKHIVDWCGCSPNDFKITDLQRLMKYEEKPLFFARKFEAVVNQEIINSLDVLLFGHLQQGLTALSSYWQNEFHHLDSPPKNRDAHLTFYHSFMRLTSDLLARRHPEAGLRPLKVLEVTVFQEGDHFHGLLVLFSAQVGGGGGEVREVGVETHVHPKHYYSVLDSKALMGRLQFLEVGSDFDPKELIFRNYGRLLGPYDDLTLRHVWGPGKELTVSVAWIDPTNVIAVSYDIVVPTTTFVGSHKPSLNRPLRPGVWTVKLMLNMSVVADTQFLVTPITFHQGRAISDSVAQRTHSGPPGLYMGKDFSGLRAFLKVPPSPQLTEEANANARKVGHDLHTWVDSLVPLFWVTKETCSLDRVELTSLPQCANTQWSSRSPDPKADAQTIGATLPFGR